MVAATHKLIAKHAVILAHECYEATATHSNAFYRQWPNKDDFCRMNWHLFVPQVRETFVDMLTLPDEDHPHWNSLTDEQKLSKRYKDEIHEALCYDGAAKAQIVVEPEQPSAKARLMGSSSLH